MSEINYLEMTPARRTALCYVGAVRSRQDKVTPFLNSELTFNEHYLPTGILVASPYFDQPAKVGVVFRPWDRLSNYSYQKYGYDSFGGWVPYQCLGVVVYPNGTTGEIAVIYSPAPNNFIRVDDVQIVSGKPTALTSGPLFRAGPGVIDNLVPLNYGIFYRYNFKGGYIAPDRGEYPSERVYSDWGAELDRNLTEWLVANAEIEPVKDALLNSLNDF